MWKIVHSRIQRLILTKVRCKLEKKKRKISSKLRDFEYELPGNTRTDHVKASSSVNTLLV